MGDQSRTRADQIIAGFKNHRAFAWLFILGSVFLVVGQFAGAFKSIREIFSAPVSNHSSPPSRDATTPTPSTQPPQASTLAPFGKECVYVYIDRFLAETVDDFPSGFGLYFQGKQFRFSDKAYHLLFILKNYDPVGYELGIIDFSPKLLLPKITNYAIRLNESRFFLIGAMDPTVSPTTENEFIRQMAEMDTVVPSCISLSPGPTLIELKERHSASG